MPTDTLRACVRYHRPGFALDAELEASPGVTVLFGASGAGKSTLLAVLAGLLRPAVGRVSLGDDVWLDSQNRVERAVQARKIAFVFQSLALFPHLTAAANVAYGITDRTSAGARLARARELLERFRVSHVEGRKPRTFSGGEAQRVALARAFAMSPRLALFDEPFSALDRALRDDLAKDLRAVIGDLGIPLVHVTHDRDEARTLADQVLLIEGGRIVRAGSADEVVPAAVNR